MRLDDRAARQVGRQQTLYRDGDAEPGRRRFDRQAEAVEAAAALHGDIDESGVI